MRIHYLKILIFVFLLTSLSAKQTNWDLTGMPIINYNSDDGMGYGFTGNIIDYAEGEYKPYYLKISPVIFRTTEGKRLYSLFIDSPYLMGQTYRLKVRAVYHKANRAPYYGAGNSSSYNPEYIDQNSSKYRGKNYYIFNRTQYKFLFQLQHNLALIHSDKKGFSYLLGAGMNQGENYFKNNPAGPTKLENDLQQGNISKKSYQDGLSNFVKLGLLYDTRDSESFTTSGAYESLLIERHSEYFAGEFNFTRLTFIDRHYFELYSKLVFANRIVWEKLFGTVPLTLNYPFGRADKVYQGLGGVRTLRGVFKNRYFGNTEFFMNTELRYQFYSCELLGQKFDFTGVIFNDFGRVWKNDMNGFNNLHFGRGAGLYLTWNKNFTCFVNFAYSNEANLQIYIDTEFLF